MGNVYHLCSYVKEEAAVLRGKVFDIYNDNGCVVFVDAVTKNVLFKSSQIIESKTDEYGKRFLKDEKGSSYTITEIEVVELPDNLEVIDERHDFRNIRYGDGFSEIIFTFNCPLSYGQFIFWYDVTYNHISILERNSVPWWMDYDTISGSGTTWSHKTINRYTD